MSRRQHFAIFAVLVLLTLLAPFGYNSTIQVTAAPPPNHPSISIPAVGITSPIVSFPFENRTWQIAPYEPNIGHLEHTDWFGDGNTILGGHSRYPDLTDGILAGLHDIAVHDDIYVETGSGGGHYRVEEVYTVDENDLSPLNFELKNTLTFITCYIPSHDAVSNTYSQRLIVVATEVRS